EDLVDRENLVRKIRMIAQPLHVRQASPLIFEAQAHAGHQVKLRHGHRDEHVGLARKEFREFDPNDTPSYLGLDLLARIARQIYRASPIAAADVRNTMA